MKKSEQVIKEEWKESNYENNPRLIYKWDVLNHKAYYPIVLPILIENIKRITKIKESKRRTEYNISRSSTSSKTSKREEERFCMALFFTQKYDKKRYPFGEVVNYQVPLKPRKNECCNTDDIKEIQEGMGKIDVISKMDNIIYLIEVKRLKTSESLLKTIFEIYTYFKQAVQNKEFIKEFNCKSANFKPAILLFKESAPAKEISSRNKDIKILLELLEKDIKTKINFFVVEDNAEVENIDKITVFQNKILHNIKPVKL